MTAVKSMPLMGVASKTAGVAEGRHLKRITNMFASSGTPAAVLSAWFCKAQSNGFTCEMTVQRMTGAGQPRCLECGSIVPLGRMVYQSSAFPAQETHSTVQQFQSHTWIPRGRGGKTCRGDK